MALGLELTDSIPYADRADVGQSYVLYVGAMCSAGLMDGFEDNTIRPGSVLTRAQAATLIYRAAGSADIERVTAAPDGSPFARRIDLGSYDNPNFSVTPVSYTHLDVYKRQRHPRLLRRGSRKPAQRGGAHGRVQRQALHPVSYTHLDVYKRQR